MQATAQLESPLKTSAQPSFIEEFQEFCRTLPNKEIFLLLLVAWIALFYFFGYMTTMAGRNSSLFDWVWRKWSDETYDAEHGKLIPFAVLGLLWYRREQLLKSARGVWWPGLFLFGSALLIHLVGYVIQQPRLSIVAFCFGAWGLIGLIWGPRILMVTLFPFFVFAFCIPLGGTFAQGFTLPLRMSAAKSAQYVVIHWFQIPVERVGTILSDPEGVYGNYDVAAACSGIRSLLALSAISTILAIVTVRTWWRRALLISLCVPLAYFCNVFRLITIIFVAKAFESKAAGELAHHWFGYVTYAIGLGGVLLAAKFLKEPPEAPTQ